MTAGLLVRRPAVAGSFYPADPAALAEEVHRSIGAARPPAPGAAVPKALVVPHAGFVYSGPIAASGYLRVAPGAAAIRRVVLLGPSHRVPVEGLAVTAADAFATPLGLLPVDADARLAALACASVGLADAPHRWEHSLEVQLPFLQLLLGDVTVLPIVVGHARPDDVADVLDVLWGGPETLIVVSTDLSHYLPYEQARAVDQRTARAVVEGRGEDIADQDACGAAPLRGLLEAARRHGVGAELVDLRNSGDTAGDRARVVGYGAFVLA